MIVGGGSSGTMNFCQYYYLLELPLLYEVVCAAAGAVDII